MGEFIEINYLMSLTETFGGFHSPFSTPAIQSRAGPVQSGWRCRRSGRVYFKCVVGGDIVIILLFRNN